MEKIHKLVQREVCVGLREYKKRRGRVRKTRRDQSTVMLYVKKSLRAEKGTETSESWDKENRRDERTRK
jgi:hypothetical protein